MKTIYHKATLLLFCTIIYGIPLLSQNITLPPGGGNQKASVSQWMGLVKVSFTYNSPDVTGPSGEDRTGKIWGQLVPWGMVNLGFGTAEKSPWRAGANENTVFYTSHDILVEGEKLPAGHYGFHLIPGENEPWTVIFSDDYASWGSYFYDPSHDVLRVEVQPEKSDFSEWLTYGFTDRELNSCTAFLSWENLSIPIKLEVPDIHQLYVEKIRQELKSSPGFSYESWMQAAQFCATNNVNLEEALTWADNAISTPFIGKENFETLQTKAMVLNAMEQNEEADAIMDKAIEHPTADMQSIHQYGRSLINEERYQKALEVFQKNAKLHPEDKFTTRVGLARGYAATGDTKKAIKYWEEAIKNIPENQKAYLSYYKAELEKLK